MTKTAGKVGVIFTPDVGVAETDDTHRKTMLAPQRMLGRNFIMMLRDAQNLIHVLQIAIRLDVIDTT